MRCTNPSAKVAFFPFLIAINHVFKVIFAFDEDGNGEVSSYIFKRSYLNRRMLVDVDVA